MEEEVEGRSPSPSSLPPRQLSCLTSASASSTESSSSAWLRQSGGGRPATVAVEPSRPPLHAVIRRIYRQNHCQLRKSHNDPSFVLQRQPPPPRQRLVIKLDRKKLHELSERKLEEIQAALAQSKQVVAAEKSEMKANYRDLMLKWKIAQAEREAEAVANGTLTVHSNASVPPRRRRRFYSKFAEDGSYIGGKDLWKKYAAVPPDLLTPAERTAQNYRFQNCNGLVSSEEILAEVQSRQILELSWTFEEIQMFFQKFYEFGKKFKEIAKWIPGKPLPLVVAFYYRIKQTSKAFQPIRAAIKERRRKELAMYYTTLNTELGSEQQQSSSSSSSTSSGTAATAGSGTAGVGRPKSSSGQHRVRAPMPKLNIEALFPMLFEGVLNSNNSIGGSSGDATADAEALRELQRELLLDVQNRPRTRHQKV